MSTERRSTPAVGNEAAERLRARIAAALAAERRAVVERIKPVVEKYIASHDCLEAETDEGCEYQAKLYAILDAEASDE